MSNPDKSVTSQLLLLFKLAFPIILGNFAYALLGITDIMMSGMAGTSDQAGVAIGGSFFIPSITFIIGIISALHPVISRHCGADKKHLIPSDHAHAVVAAFIVGCIIMCILLFLAYFVIDMDADKRMEETARDYVMYIAFGMPVFALNNSARAYAEAMGNTRATLYFGSLAVILNVPLNYVFIFGHYGMPALGGAGCGLASLLSMFISCVVIYAYIMLTPNLKNYHWLKNKTGFHKKELLAFYKLSLPLGISTSVEASCFSLIAIILSPLGSTQVSANSITMSMTSFVFNIPLSLGIATAIMVGYSIGQNNLNNLRLNIKAAYASMLVSIVVSVSILLIGSTHLPRMFSTDPEVLALSTSLMFFASVNQSFEGIQTIQAFILRGFKDTTTILMVTFIAFYCVALPIGYSLCYGYITLPFDTIFADTGLKGARGFWIGLLCGLLAAAILYRRRVLFHYRKLKYAATHDERLN